MIKGTLMAITIIIYAVVFMKALTKKKQTTVEKAVLRTAFVGFLHCWGEVLLIIALLSQLNGISQNDWFCVNLDTFWLLVNGGTCMFSTITPYALIGLCTPIRERFFEMWCGFIVKKKSTNVAVVTASQPEEQKPRNQAIQQNRHH
uniref:Uncharacterized protein n=1 Tax=Plectus sambesii TaxID=2011161 RepID=A0A914WQN1_9BILA